MGGKISIKDKAAVDAGIKDFGTQQAAITALGTALKTELDELVEALGITVDGQGADGDVPSGLGDGAKDRADDAASSLGTLATGWQNWSDGLQVIQDQAAQAVNGAAPKPTDPAPADSTPADEKPNTGGVWFQPVAPAKPDEPTPAPNPAAAPPGTPAAFAMR